MVSLYFGERLSFFGEKKIHSNKRPRQGQKQNHATFGRLKKNLSPNKAYFDLCLCQFSSCYSEYSAGDQCLCESSGGPFKSLPSFRFTCYIPGYLLCHLSKLRYSLEPWCGLDWYLIRPERLPPANKEMDFSNPEIF